MRTDAFDFDLPDELVALRPAERRDAARLLTVTPAASGTPHLSDTSIAALDDLLAPGDALVLNNTKVLAAFLKGVRIRGEAQAAVSLNLFSRLDANRWTALAKPARRLKVGDRIHFTNEIGTELQCTIDRVADGGFVEVCFEGDGGDLDGAIDAAGLMPLPHYIASKRTPDGQDRESYQTVFAEHAGAVAAPTAGLHFTPSLLKALEARGVSCLYVTLHVGGGTFLPVKVDDTQDHVMHAEWGEITKDTATRLNAVRAAGGRIVAVGTTSLRLLESAAASDGTLKPFRGETDIFITPGYRFKVVDRLLTNFHLPKSTLFMLVSAFSGLEAMKHAYTHAIGKRYRFYSYGDACLLDRAL